MIVRPLSTVDNTRDYARVSHSRQWSNYNIHVCALSVVCRAAVDSMLPGYPIG